MLAFLPGQREIERTAERLEGRVAADIDIVPLYGQLDASAQDAAIKPAPAGRRKVVLATSIAETSITIDGVRVVVDSGLSRVPRYEPARGLTRLETVRGQQGVRRPARRPRRAHRAGRGDPIVAGRADGVASRPTIRRRSWRPTCRRSCSTAPPSGSPIRARLAFLDPPPAAALDEARTLLASLDAIDDAGRLTEAGSGDARARSAGAAGAYGRGGRALRPARRPNSPCSSPSAALAATAPTLNGGWSAFRTEKSPRAVAARQLADRLARQRAGSPERGADSPRPGVLLLHAWPDRVAKARGERGRFVLSNGSRRHARCRRPAAGRALSRRRRSAGQGAKRAHHGSGGGQRSRHPRRAGRQDRSARRITNFDRERRAVRARETRAARRVCCPSACCRRRQAPTPIARYSTPCASMDCRCCPGARRPKLCAQRLAWLHRGRRRALAGRVGRGAAERPG